MYRFRVRLRLGLQAGLIFRFILQTAYLIYRYSVDGISTNRIWEKISLQLLVSWSH